jgi:hypothetical protein
MTKNRTQDPDRDRISAYHTFRGVDYTIAPESDGVWCWRRDDGVGGVHGGFTSKEAAAADAKRAIDENVDNTRQPANDNGERAVAPAPAGGALTSLKALEVALSGVNTSSLAGRSGLSMLQFKREGSGTWLFGQKKTVVEDGSLWGINPLTFKWGSVGFSNDNKAHERLVPVNQPKPDVTELPDMGFEWRDQMTVNLKCLSGADTGLEVVFKTATDGGIKAVVGMIDAVQDRFNGGEHEGKVVPIVKLGKDSYPHGQYGRIWYPVMEITDWMPLNGPAPAPKPTSPPPPRKPPAAAEQAASAPRRRRVA